MIESRVSCMTLLVEKGWHKLSADAVRHTHGKHDPERRSPADFGEKTDPPILQTMERGDPGKESPGSGADWEQEIRG